MSVDTRATSKCEMMVGWTPVVRTEVAKSDQNSNTWKAELIRYTNGL